MGAAAIIDAMGTPARNSKLAFTGGAMVTSAFTSRQTGTPVSRELPHPMRSFQ